MKPSWIASSVLAVSLVMGTPNPGFAHVGHGDEFQAKGGVQRVKVNTETDQMLGIAVTSIEPAAKSGSNVMIPVTAVVDADGKQLVFVKYESFYEPVPVTTGATKGELVEVTQGLSVGEKLVTQGSLSLYAESRKTQAAPSPSTASSPAATHAQADAQGIPHNHDASGNLAQSGATASKSGGFPMGLVAVVAGGGALLAGSIAVLAGRNKKSSFPNKRGDL